MTALSELIARVEAAPEGSRELDAAIWALGAAIQGPLEFGREQYTEGAYREWVRCDSLGEWMDNIPHYTTSLDAKLPQEDEGWWNITGPRMYLHIPSRAPNYWKADFAPLATDGLFTGWGATEALARRVAALKARESQP